MTTRRLLAVIAANGKQLHRIARGVIDNNLLASDAGRDVVSEMRSSLPQLLHGHREIIDFDRESIPATWLLLSTIGHVVAASSGWVRCTQDEPEVASREHRKHRRRVHHGVKPELLLVERDCRVNVVNDASHLNGGQSFSSSR